MHGVPSSESDFPLAPSARDPGAPIAQHNSRTRRAGAALLVLVIPSLAGPVAAAPAPAAPPDTETAIAHAEALSAAFESAAAKVQPAVVNITATIGGDEPAAQPPARRQPQMEDPFEEFRRRLFGDPFGGGGRQMRRPVQTSMGSGIIVSADGYVLTNNHVIDNASKVEVTLADNAKYPAKIVGTDPATDIAVIKIERASAGGNGESQSAASFPHAALGDSDAVRVGQWVVAIGNPFGLNQTVTAGIVSAKNRVQNGPGQLQDVQYQDFIQTDAAINKGNSGGPLINLRGEVIGINSAIIGPANVGIGFAIPTNMAKGVMDSLIASGKVERGYLGINLQALTDEVAKYHELSGKNGAVVTEVGPGTPAEQAGLKVGDIITRFQGRPVTNDQTLRNAIAAAGPGKKVEFELFREGKKQTVEATLGSRTDAAMGGELGDDNSFTSPVKGGLGLSVTTLTPEVAEKLGERRNTRGVVITEVLSNSSAAGVLGEGDVILQVMNRRVENAAEFREALQGTNLRRGVQLIVRQGGQTRIVVLRGGQ